LRKFAGGREPRRRGFVSMEVEVSMSITKPVQPARNHIQSADVKCWARHWHVTEEQLRMTIEKTGNSVVAVRKELAAGHPENMSL
jgi:hypothetical protein